MTQRRQIHVLVSQQDEIWVAQCLEYDISAQASDLDQVRRRLIATINDEYEESVRRYGKAFVGIDPAPAHFHRLWDARSTTLGQSSMAGLDKVLDMDVEFALAA